MKSKLNRCLVSWDVGLLWFSLRRWRKPHAANYIFTPFLMQKATRTKIQLHYSQIYGLRTDKWKVRWEKNRHRLPQNKNKWTIVLLYTTGESLVEGLGGARRRLGQHHLQTGFARFLVRVRLVDRSCKRITFKYAAVKKRCCPFWAGHWTYREYVHSFNAGAVSSSLPLSLDDDAASGSCCDTRSISAKRNTFY